MRTSTRLLLAALLWLGAANMPGTDAAEVITPPDRIVSGQAR